MVSPQSQQIEFSLIITNRLFDMGSLLNRVSFFLFLFFFVHNFIKSIYQCSHFLYSYSNYFFPILLFHSTFLLFFPFSITSLSFHLPVFTLRFPLIFDCLFYFLRTLFVVCCFFYQVTIIIYIKEKEKKKKKQNKIKTKQKEQNSNKILTYSTI